MVLYTIQKQAEVSGGKQLVRVYPSSHLQRIKLRHDIDLALFEAWQRGAITKPRWGSDNQGDYFDIQIKKGFRKHQLAMQRKSVAEVERKKSSSLHLPIHYSNHTLTKYGEVPLPIKKDSDQDLVCTFFFGNPKRQAGAMDDIINDVLTPEAIETLSRRIARLNARVKKSWRIEQLFRISRKNQTITQISEST